MVTLKDISHRLRSIISIQKITKSMKMVAASKYARAERELKSTKPFGLGALDFYDKTGLKEKIPEKPDSRLMIVMSSDKGLCGSIHAGLFRHIRSIEGEDASKTINTKYILLGDKIRLMMQRNWNKKFITTASGIGRKPLSFTAASIIAATVNEHADQFSKVEILHNFFRTVLAYQITTVPVFTADQMEKSQVLLNYDSADSETIRCFQEFHLAALIYYTFKQNFACELASRMNAMEGATKNAGEIIEKLTLYYNRTRQFVITKELIEIISGASVLEQQEAF